MTKKSNEKANYSAVSEDGSADNLDYLITFVVLHFFGYHFRFDFVLKNDSTL